MSINGVSSGGTAFFPIYLSPEKLDERKVPHIRRKMLRFVNWEKMISGRIHGISGVYVNIL